MSRAEHISDAYLSQQPFAPEAERTIRKRLRAAKIDVDALTGDALADARLAMLHACASVLCLTAPQMVRPIAIADRHGSQSIDWQEKMQFHDAKVNGLVDDIIESVEGECSPTKRTRALPFGAVGTVRREVGEPSYPYVRRVYNDR